MEAVIFGFLHHIEVLRERGLPINRIVTSEGGASSPLWRQIAADILNQPIYSLQENPGSANGAAMVAGRSIGIIENWEKIDSFPRSITVNHPEQADQWVYKKNYQIYRDMYPKLKELF